MGTPQLLSRHLSPRPVCYLSFSGGKTLAQPPPVVRDDHRRPGEGASWLHAPRGASVCGKRPRERAGALQGSQRPRGTPGTWRERVAAPHCRHRRPVTQGCSADPELAPGPPPPCSLEPLAPASTPCSLLPPCPEHSPSEGLLRVRDAEGTEGADPQPRPAKADTPSLHLGQRGPGLDLSRKPRPARSLHPHSHPTRPWQSPLRPPGPGPLGGVLAFPGHLQIPISSCITYCIQLCFLSCTFNIF